MNHKELQERLRDRGVYSGPIDGKVGPITRAGIIVAMTSPTARPLDAADYAQSAERLNVDVRAIKAVVKVEAGKSGFGASKLPLILAEPHVFSRLTKHRYDASHPTLSYRSWDKSKYPAKQPDRWDQLTRMVGVNVDAGFSSASYGLFQIMGFHYEVCGFKSPYDMVAAHAVDEAEQLKAFEKFITKSGLLPHLRNRDWAKFARGYNGSGYAANKYDTRLAAAYKSATVA